MEEEYIDTRNSRRVYEKCLARFLAEPRINDHNKQLVQTFLRDAALGKTVTGRAKKKIGPARLTKFIIALQTMVAYLNKDLDKITQDDMEGFIEALETDVIRSRKPSAGAIGVVPSDGALQPQYKADIKKIVKKFYKWLWGGSRAYPPIVEWIDTYVQEKEVPALTEAEVQRLVDRARTPLQRALIQVLFDGGFRIGELLNIRLRHVRLMRYNPTDLSQTCFVCRVPFSKTLRRTVALPMNETTRYLSAWLSEHPARPLILRDGSIDAEDTSRPLFPMSDNAVRLMIRKVGFQALAKRVYPHLLRHTSATYWSNKLPYFKLCKRFGWSMTSKMPQRYIDREGVDELEVASIYHQSVKKEPNGPAGTAIGIASDPDTEPRHHTVDPEPNPHLTPPPPSGVPTGDRRAPQIWDTKS